MRDEEVADPEAFLTKAAGLFQGMRPFNDYLNRALADFRMPER